MGVRYHTGFVWKRPFRTRIDRRFDWSELPAALDHLASGTARGRVVVTRG